MFVLKQMVVALGILAATSALAAPQKHGPSGAAPDANAIVRQMVQTYQRANTIQETSVANFEEINGVSVSQSNTLRFQRPNLLAEITQDPNGELSAYSNGKTI